MKPKRNKDQTIVDEGLKDIARAVGGGAKKLGRAVADRATGRGPSKEQRKSTKEREKKVKVVSNQAFHAWKDYEDNVAKSIHNEEERDSFKNHDERWADTFRGWVSKNLLNGQSIDDMNNSSDLNYVVDYITASGDKKKMTQHAAAPAQAPTRQSTAPLRATQQQPTRAATKPTATKATAAATTAVQPTASAQPAAQEPTEPAPELEQPKMVSRGGVERTSVDPMILRRGRAEYMLGDAGQWVKVGQKHPENESMQALLDQAAEEFENADQEALERRSEAGYTPEPTAQPQATHQAKEPPQLVPGQTQQAPSPEQARAEKETFAQAQAQQVALAQQQRAAAEREQQAQDEADRAAGVEPRSRGIKKVSGHGQSAQFEPLKESLRRKIAEGVITPEQARVQLAQFKRLRDLNEAMEEKLERDAFATLVRAAMLSQPMGGDDTATGDEDTGTWASGKRLTDREKRAILDQQLPKLGSLPKMGQFFREQYGMTSAGIQSTGNDVVDSMLTKMGFQVR